MSVASEATESKLTIRRLHPALGAEVRGLDLGRPLDAASFEALRAAWAEHLVLVFPGQAIDDAAQIAFSRRFGELEVHHQTIIRSARAPEIFRVANVDEEGQLMAPEHPSVAQIKLAQRWHTDSSFRAIPSTGAILHGLEVVASGGETCFTNMYRVYDALPPALKDRIEGRKARHDFANLERLGPDQAAVGRGTPGDAAGLASACPPPPGER